MSKISEESIKRTTDDMVTLMRTHLGPVPSEGPGPDPQIMARLSLVPSFDRVPGEPALQIAWTQETEGWFDDDWRWHEAQSERWYGWYDSHDREQRLDLNQRLVSLSVDEAQRVLTGIHDQLKPDVHISDVSRDAGGVRTFLACQI